MPHVIREVWIAVYFRMATSDPCLFLLFVFIPLQFRASDSVTWNWKMSLWLSVVMQDMWIPEKLSRSCKYSEHKDFLFYFLGNAGWIFLIKSCLCCYFVGTVRSNQVITTSRCPCTLLRNDKPAFHWSH